MSLKERFNEVMGVEEMDIPVPIIDEVVPAEDAVAVVEEDAVPEVIDEVVPEVEPEVVIPAIDPDDHALVIAQNEVLSSEVELVKLENEIDHAEEDIDDLQARVVDLEERLAGMEAMVNGERPWNPELAQHLYTEACKTVGAVMGLRGVHDLVKGTESFVDVKTAQIELVDNLGKLSQRAAEMHTGMEGFFANLYNKVLDWLEASRSGIDSLDSEAGAMLAKVGNTNPKGFATYIYLGAWNRFLDIQSHDNPFSHIDQLRKPLASLEAALKVQNVDKFKSDYPKALNEIVSALSKTTSTKTELVTTTTGEFNGHLFKVVCPNSGLEGGDLLRAIDMSSVKYKENSKSSISLDGVYETQFNRDKLVALMKAAGALGRQVRQVIPTRAQVDSIRKGAEKVEDKAEGDNATAEDKQDLKELKRLHTAANKAAKTLLSYIIGTLRASISMANANLKKTMKSEDATLDAAKAAAITAIAGSVTKAVTG